MPIVTLDLPLDLIHRLYGLAIAHNTTIDEVVGDILQEYLDKEEVKEKIEEESEEDFCEWKVKEHKVFNKEYLVIIKQCLISKRDDEVTPIFPYSSDMSYELRCNNCGKLIYWGL